MVTRPHPASRQKKPSTLTQDLNTGAVGALDKAREMPPGDERTEAMHKATVFEMLRSSTNFSAASAVGQTSDESAGGKPAKQ